MVIRIEQEIKASVERVWGILLEKVHAPDQFIPGIEEFEIQERGENEWIRSLYTETDDVVELITIFPEEKKMIFSLVRHAFLKGTLSHQIFSKEENSVLVFEQDREITLSELEGLDMKPALEAALLQIKEKAEN